MNNPWGSLAWGLSTLVVISTTRNPFYLGLFFAALALLERWSAAQSNGQPSAMPFSPLKISLLIVPSAALFNALLSPYGDTTLLVLPFRLPPLSDRLTLEGLLYGGINGLALATIVLVFALLQRALAVATLLRLIPRAFYPLAIVTSIALTFLPSTRRQLEQIIEAQRIRGRTLTKPGDFLPLIVPLLSGGLERSLQLAEAMTARGWVGEESQKAGRGRIPLLVGLLLSALSVVFGARQELARLAPFLLGGGLATTSLTLWWAGRARPRHPVRRYPWRLSDRVSFGLSVVAIAVWIFLLPATARETLFYQPYPRVAVPPFDCRVMALLLSIAALGLWHTRKPAIGNEEARNL